ncbi:MAG TPA: cytidyltransferase, partial [Balneola sp.]|nr:cytidyltransferase [Balneola sp.]
MKNFREITEKSGDTAVFTFGRFNPPTLGHEKVVNAVAAQQKKNSGSKMYVYASHSNDPKRNPLSHPKKLAYMRKMLPKYKRNIVASKARNIFEIATELHDKGHRAIVMVVGSDRVDEFDDLLNKYNGEDSRHGFYGFDNIEVVSAGERDPDS